MQITFQVTQKTATKPGTDAAAQGGAAQLRLASLQCTAWYLVYFAAVAAGLVCIVALAALRKMTLWGNMMNAAAFGWAAMVCLMIWPPVSTLLPREETEQGWRVR